MLLIAQDRIQYLIGETNGIKGEYIDLVNKVNPEAETNDKDYVFMTFVMDHLPIGLVGLLFAVIFSGRK